MKPAYLILSLFLTLPLTHLQTQPRVKDNQAAARLQRPAEVKQILAALPVQITSMQGFIEQLEKSADGKTASAIDLMTGRDNPVLMRGRAEQIVTLAARSLGYVGETDGILKQISSRPESAFSALILAETAEALAIAGYREKAIELTDTAERVARKVLPLPPKALVAISRCHVELGRWERAREVAALVSDPLLRVKALRVVAEAMLGAGKVDDALVLLSAAPETIKQIDPRLLGRGSEIGTVAQLFAKAGRLQEALKVGGLEEPRYFPYRSIALVDEFKNLSPWSGHFPFPHFPFRSITSGKENVGKENKHQDGKFLKRSTSNNHQGQHEGEASASQIAEASRIKRDLIHAVASGACPSTHSSPSSKISFFQMGTVRFRRSIA
jgi:hypothetical protein